MTQSEVPPGFLSEDKFLQYFKPKKALPKTPEQLAKIMIVTYTYPQTMHEILTLTPNTKGRTILKGPDDKRYKWAKKIAEYYFDILVTNRDNYLRKLYQAYFKVKIKDMPDFQVYDDVVLSNNTLSLQRHDASRRVIRNLFHLELLDQTTVTNSVKSHVPFWRSLVNLYNLFELEDRFFATSSIEQCLQPKSPSQPINYNTLFYLFQAFQPKASILNPYLIWWLWNKPIKEYPTNQQRPLRLFTPVMSWCSYLLAYLKTTPSKIDHYVGIDVMPSVIQKARKMAKAIDAQRMPELYLCPSEKLAHRYPSKFGPKGSYKNYFDLTILCPPYYDMELYPTGQQSTNSFPSYDEWLEGYWRPTAQLICHVSCKESLIMLIINDYTSLDGKHYPLTKDLSEILQQEGFKHIQTYYLANRVSPLRVNFKDRLERLMLFVPD